MWLLVLIPVVCLGVWGGFRYRRKIRRRRLVHAPFPAEWLTILKDNVPLYNRLPEDLREKLRGHIQVFIDEKRFTGCGGLAVDDEMKVTIAASACILLLGRKTRYYPSFTSIFVYPTAYLAQSKRMSSGVESVIDETRLGESWHRGPMVLAWDAVRRGAYDIKDGHNVVFHEFAHKLDGQSGAMDGTPLLGEGSRYKVWAKTMGREYKALIRKVQHHEKSVMDAYGASQPPEFFAVLTETFFEKPKQLKRKHPELYEEVKTYYRLDPAEWV